MVPSIREVLFNPTCNICARHRKVLKHQLIHLSSWLMAIDMVAAIGVAHFHGEVSHVCGSVGATVCGFASLIPE